MISWRLPLQSVTTKYSTAGYAVKRWMDDDLKNITRFVWSVESVLNVVKWFAEVGSNGCLCMGVSVCLSHHSRWNCFCVQRSPPNPKATIIESPSLFKMLLLLLLVYIVGGFTTSLRCRSLLLCCCLYFISYCVESQFLTGNSRYLQKTRPLHFKTESANETKENETEKASWSNNNDDDNIITTTTAKLNQQRRGVNTQTQAERSICLCV